MASLLNAAVWITDRNQSGDGQVIEDHSTSFPLRMVTTTQWQRRTLGVRILSFPLEL